jgi:hypothetical protein
MMYIKNARIRIQFDQLKTLVPIDSMNSTVLAVNDVECESVDGAVFVPQLSRGDQVELDTRSSSWRGVVEKMEGDGAVILIVEAEGHFESFRNGLSGLLNWTICDMHSAIIETSLHDSAIPLDVYVKSKELAMLACGNNDRDVVWRDLIKTAMKYASAPSPNVLDEHIRQARLRSNDYVDYIRAEAGLGMDNEILGYATLSSLRNNQ